MNQPCQPILALYRYKTALDALASHVDVGRRLLSPIFTGEGPLDSAAAEAALEAVGDHPLALHEDNRDVDGITARALTGVFAAFNYADDVMNTAMSMTCAINELEVLRRLARNKE